MAIRRAVSNKTLTCSVMLRNTAEARMYNVQRGLLATSLPVLCVGEAHRHVAVWCNRSQD